MPDYNTSPSFPHEFLQLISDDAFLTEPEAIKRLLPLCQCYNKESDNILLLAQKYVHGIRKELDHNGMEGFIHEFGLNNKEGIAIMCIAEALLRIPDAHTANALIHDKFSGTHWDEHLGNGDSLFMNASVWSLMLTGHVLHMGKDHDDKPSNLLGRLISRAGEPVIRNALKKAMGLMGSQFVLANTIEQAINQGKSLRDQFYLFSFDMLGEGARTDQQAEQFYELYRHAIITTGQQADALAITPPAEYHLPKSSLFHRPSMSIKLSALHPRYQWLQKQQIMDELVPRIKSLLMLAMEHNIAVAIDAEEATRLDLSLEIYNALHSDTAFDGYDGIGFVLQAYQKRALPIIDFIEEISKRYKRRIPVRLVKGAYWDSEIKQAQTNGLKNYPVFTRKSHTDVSYLACASKLLDNQTAFYPQFATHNALSIAAIIETYGTKDMEFQRLYGMGESLHDQVVHRHPCRIYAPVGQHRELLPYLIRRLLENGANASFVNLVADKEIEPNILLRNPIIRAEDTGGRPHENIPLPKDLYGNQRLNSEGIDLGNRSEVKKLWKECQEENKQLYHAFSVINGVASGDVNTHHDVYSPFADKHEKNPIGSVYFANQQDVDTALTSATKAFHSWSQTSPEHRATILRKAADLFSDEESKTISLLQREGGKTIEDAISEVRETIDFCRYYAAECERLMSNPVTLPSPVGEINTLALDGKGVFTCISPWNFPLAIFIGQITAALASGNSVIAKPAAQTPLIAHFSVCILHKAGVPSDVLQLLIGQGSEIGPMLTASNLTTGVAFTGSTETAHHINRSLAKRDGAIATLIAETGGLNAMIVDSSALPEQAVDDIIISAFGSAGQRCSALRVLFVQNEIADTLLTLLQGAVAKLTVGSPLNWDTDIGPVIDNTSAQILRDHIKTIQEASGVKLVGKSSLTPAYEDHPCFVAPHIIEIADISLLEREVFGPVLHVIRFNGAQLDNVIDRINQTGYGLTFGMHSRLQQRIDYAHRKVQAGNHYANRSMTGAVVGVQPFGGMGLSGTGFKAGGPHYLLRFMHERTWTENSAAIGGDITLLS